MNEYSLGIVFFNELVVYLSSFIQCTYITVPSMDKKDNGLCEGSEGKNEGAYSLSGFLSKSYNKLFT